MKKKALSIVLAGTMALSMTAVSAVSVSAEELAPGGFGTLGEYTPNTGVKTNKLMFAMPGAWQNDTTKDAKCGGAAGIYWWSGYDTPDDKAGGHGWPGYKSVQVAEEGVSNLWAIDVPTYGNGEKGDATQIIWNNYLDGGMETDPVKNPFYAASTQTIDTPGQFYDRSENSVDKDNIDHPYYTYVIKYAYQKFLSDAGVPGMADLDFTSNTFWVDANKLCAAYLGGDYDSLDNDAKTYQVDVVFDELDVDFNAIFGDKYGPNFFNEDLVPDALMYGLAFTFNNMVYVVDFDVSKMNLSPVSKKLGFGGDFYFYYGGGEYGSWPTKELNEEMKTKLGEDKVASGSFITGEYITKTMAELMKEYEEYHKDDPTDPPTTAPSTTVPSPSQDATSSTSSTSSGSTTANNSNGAVATGQVSMIVILLVVIAAGIGVVVFTRKKTEK